MLAIDCQATRLNLPALWTPAHGLLFEQRAVSVARWVLPIQALPPTNGLPRCIHQQWLRWLAGWHGLPDAANTRLQLRIWRHAHGLSLSYVGMVWHEQASIAMQIAQTAARWMHALLPTGYACQVIEQHEQLIDQLQDQWLRSLPYQAFVRLQHQAIVAQPFVSAYPSHAWQASLRALWASASPSLICLTVQPTQLYPEERAELQRQSDQPAAQLAQRWQHCWQRSLLVCSTDPLLLVAGLQADHAPSSQQQLLDICLPQAEEHAAALAEVCWGNCEPWATTDWAYQRLAQLIANEQLMTWLSLPDLSPNERQTYQISSTNPMEEAYAATL
ncbi:hypothetical protein [Herpetosiphon gulosus]|uniref:DUF4123 domain-containing protein n=1 Tax=Herpetosiphon gulosus TaxID=1973496 RepID=A0ABP9WYQ3_9CHLR